MKVDWMNNLKYIVFIGTGGTGGWLIPSIVRMVSFIPAFNDLRIVFIDPDIVEENNILRQNFIPTDVGQHKAKIFAQRYGPLFNVKTSYIIDKVTPEFFRAHNNIFNRSLIIDTVDNNRARKYIHNFVGNDYKRVLWMSAGNSDKEGQMTFIDGYGSKKGRSVVDIWPEQFTESVLEAERREEEARNCAINAVSNPQSIAINETGANVMRNFLYQLLYEHTYDSDVIFYDRFNETSKIPYGESVFGDPDEDLSSLFGEPEKSENQKGINLSDLSNVIYTYSDTSEST